MQLELPVYGFEGEEVGFANSKVVCAINAGEEAVKIGHLVVLDPRKNSCRRVRSIRDVEQGELGVVLFDGSQFEFNSGARVQVLQRGRVYVHLDSDVKTPLDPVFVNPSTGGFCGNKTDDSVQLNRSFFLSAGKSGDVILLESDLVGEAPVDEDYSRPRL